MLRLFFLCVVLCAVRCDDDPELDQMVEEIYNRLARGQARATLTDILALLTERGYMDIFDSVIWKIRLLVEDTSEFSFDSVAFRLMKLTWRNRTDHQLQLANSTCDTVMDSDDEFTELDELTRGLITDCIQSRLTIDAIRLAVPELHWIPQDLLTNPWRKYVFGIDLIKSALVYWQYTRDQIVELDLLQNATYVSQWKAMDLNVSHYATVGQTREEVDAFFRTTTLADYMQWNGAGQQVAVEWLLSMTVHWRKRTPIDEVTGMNNFFELLAKALQLPTPYK